MPFRETSPVAERIALLREFETGVFTVSELCRRHGISRETFYVWQRRWASGEARWYEAGAMRWRAVRTRRMA
jgi:transposase-like protein